MEPALISSNLAVINIILLYCYKNDEFIQLKHLSPILKRWSYTTGPWAARVDTPGCPLAAWVVLLVSRLATYNSWRDSFAGKFCGVIDI